MLKDDITKPYLVIRYDLICSSLCNAGYPRIEPSPSTNLINGIGDLLSICRLIFSKVLNLLSIIYYLLSISIDLYCKLGQALYFATM
jgi:hypothetical protein